MMNDSDDYSRLKVNVERRMTLALEKLTGEELAELAKWIKDNVEDAGLHKTSDWPGWNGVMERLSL